MVKTLELTYEQLLDLSVSLILNDAYRGGANPGYEPDHTLWAKLTKLDQEFRSEMPKDG